MGKVRRKKKHGVTARSIAESNVAVSAEEVQQPGVDGSGRNVNTISTSDMQAGVLEGLASLHNLTRESSCAAIASLFEKIDDPEACNDAWLAAKRLVADGLIKKLLPRLVDRAPEVKVQATGAVRNISAIKDPRICEIMVDNDCLTPVLTLLERMSGSNPSGRRGIEGQHLSAEQEQIVVSQIMATLCNLLAAVDVAVARFTKQDGARVVLNYLGADACRGNAEIFGGALQALHVATDSNPDLSQQLLSIHGAADQLSCLVEGKEISYINVSKAIRLQAAGILVNIAAFSKAQQSIDQQEALGHLILPLLVKEMTYDPAVLETACVELSRANMAGRDGMEVDGEGEAKCTGIEEHGRTTDADVAAAAVATSAPIIVAAQSNGSDYKRTGQISTEAHPEQHVEGESFKDKAEAAAYAKPDQPDYDALIRWRWKLEVAEPLKLTAEVLTNLCSLAAGEDNHGEDEEEWASDEEDAMEEEARNSLRVDASTGDSGDWAAVLDLLVGHDALPKTVAALQALLASTPRDRPRSVVGGTQLSTGSHLPLPHGTAADLADLRATVALCAANLVENLPLRALGSDPNELWLALCSMCEDAILRAPSCVENLTGIMWGLVRQAGPTVAAAAAGMRGDNSCGDPRSFLVRLSDPENTRAFEARVNAVGMLGALSAAPESSWMQESPAEAVAIGAALLKALEDPHVLVQAEAFNAIMDVFGQDANDEIYRTTGLAHALDTGVPAFKRKVKLEGKELGRDALCHLKETALNAGRFVKYKKPAKESNH